MSTEANISELPRNQNESPLRQSPMQREASWMPRIVGIILLACCLAGLFLSPTTALSGVSVLAMMVVLILMHVPVGIALAVPSIIGVYAISGIPAAINILGSAPFDAVSSWSLSVLPMFIFMGMLLTQSGITSNIYRATDHWFGWMPGGAGIGTTGAGAGLAAVSGSTVGVTYTLARAGIPEMLRAGYDKRVAVGTVIIAGLPGNLIPPSILLVVYAGIASVPVGPQLMAGALPGLLLAVMYGAFIFLLSIFMPSLVGRDLGSSDKKRALTWSDRFRSLRAVWAFPALIVVLFGGMFSGVFTPTEAGAAAALMSLLICLWNTRKTGAFKSVARAATAAVSATAAIFFILVGAEMLTSVMSLTGLAPLMTSLITGLGLSRVEFLVVLVVLYLLMGMFFDTLSMMLLTIPILLPTFSSLGIDPLWFGVFVVLLAELGMVTPPVGLIPFIVHDLVQDPEVNLGQKIDLRDIFTALVWFLPVSIIFLVALIVFPEISTWLPGMMMDNPM